LTCELELTAIYAAHHPNHSAYADEITAEIQKFGGNTIANFFRGGEGIPYRVGTCGAVQPRDKADSPVVAAKLPLRLFIAAPGWA
jgi:uncharacterized protein YaaW (UPF0174 family)